MNSITILTNSEDLAEAYHCSYFLDSKPITSELEEVINKDPDNLLSIALSQSLDMYCREDLFFILKVDGCVAGGVVLGFNDNGWSFNPNFKWAIKSVSLFKEYQGKKHSYHLIEAIFSFCVKNEILTLKQSNYTEDGKLKIAHIFKQISDQYPTINYIDH